MNLLLAVPSYGHIEPASAKSVRQAMMDPQVRWVDDLSLDRYPIPMARNLIYQRAVTAYPYVDGVIWVDDDMKVPRGTFSRLALRGKDFMSALCFERREPYRPIMWSSITERILKYPPDEVISPMGVGFGCVFTSMRMLKCMGDKPFGKEAYGEDWQFCERMREAGFTVYLDTGVRCGHYGEPKLVSEETYLMHNNPANVDPPKWETP